MRVASSAASDFVAHGVGHREVQHAPIQREVEGVAADFAGRFQPAREGELPSLQVYAARQQTVWVAARRRPDRTERAGLAPARVEYPLVLRRRGSSLTASFPASMGRPRPRC
jgi:hypothetical protein